MKLDIKNFRSIKDQSVELAPITVHIRAKWVRKVKLACIPCS